MSDSSRRSGRNRTASMQRQMRTISRLSYPFRLSLLGVPEQVNIPIRLCLENGIFEKYGVDVRYSTVKEGTGAMLKKLHNQEADIAITVTDGFIAGKASGSNVSLIGTFVDSPLTWAVCAAPNSKLNSIDDFMRKEEKRIGISRWKSGSHTMAYYLHLLHKLKHPSCPPLTEENFRVLGGFDTLTQGIQQDAADIFLWEVFTTKPSFDSGELKYIGEVSTPWPAFSIVANTSFAEREDTAHLYKHHFLPALSEGIQLFLQSKECCNSPNSYGWGYQGILGEGSGVNTSGMTASQRIVHDFGHQEADAKKWLESTRYSSRMAVNISSLQQATAILQQVALVPEHFDLADLWGGERNQAIRFSPTPLELPIDMIEEMTISSKNIRYRYGARR